MNNNDYNKKKYELRTTKNITELLKYCFLNNKEYLRFLILITNTQVIIGVGDDELYFNHIDIAREIQKKIYPNRNYSDSNYYENNKALMIYGYGYNSAFGDFYEKVSINQYNCLLKIFEEIKMFAEEYNCLDLIKYYNSIIEVAKNIISYDDFIEEDEVIIGNEINGNNESKKTLLKK